MSARFTSGPWFVTYTRNGTANVGPSHNCTVAALLMAPIGEMEANARLIAAAPDLLALAKQYASECAECEGRGHIVAYTDPYERGDASSPLHSPCADCADIRAVIAKATGTQP